MVAKMAKLLEKSKINQKIFIKEKDNTRLFHLSLDKGT